jgi:hypothetical protein
MRYILIPFLFAFPIFTGCSGSAEPTSTPSTHRTPINSGEIKTGVMTRYEFSLAVMGKTPDEVTAVVGKPDRTSESEGRTIWHYSKRSKHPLTDEIDPSVQVAFKGGVVVDVLF